MTKSIASHFVSSTEKFQSDWLNKALHSVNCLGFAAVEGVLDQNFLESTRLAMYRVQERIQSEVGLDRLKRANEMGVLRLMMKFDPHFFRFLEIAELLAVIDGTVGNTAIMHLQNGFVLPPSPPDSQLDNIFQLRFHMDFPRVLNQYLASINIMFAIDDFTVKNGGTLVIPGSHQQMTPPDIQTSVKSAIALECPAGSMLIFDSTLWHAAGRNQSGQDRLAINHQFTRSYIKQQMDYVRALGDNAVQTLPDRSQQLLGYYTRVVTSLDEYYRPEAERLYRKGQG